MNTNNIKNTMIRYTFLYSLVQGFFWISFAIIMGFASVYLLDCGLSNSQIGLIIGIAGLSSALLQPLVAGYADKPSSRSIKWILSIVLAVTICIAIFMMLIHGKSALLTGIIYGICVAILQFIMPFIHSLGTETISQGINLNWGFARGIGSAAYAVISPILGIIVSKLGASSVPAAIIIGYTILFICVNIFPFRKSVHTDKVLSGSDCSNDKIESFSGSDCSNGKVESLSESDCNNVKNESFSGTDTGNLSSERKPEPAPTSTAAFFRKYPKFSVLLLGLTGAYISHVILNTFMFQIIQSKGGTSVEMGVVMAFCAVIELPALFFYTFLRKKAGSDVWLRIATIFMLLKAFGTLLAVSMNMFYAVQVCQALGWALISIAPVYYVRAVIAPEDAIKGQAFVTMTYTAGSVLASVIGGWLLDLGGVFALLLFAAISGGIGAVLSILFTERHIREL